ncbi:hypothetical protein GCM10023063_15500 [Arthrobacter methylotrophus]|uniref:DUF4304 domain-containing protein n=1 Tax=Arthrobacter methylotrophus TaxID=121291 RepID=A0ABV5URG9_9MICC
MNTKPTAAERAAERFHADTADHVMEVALDQGFYRHLRFGTGFNWFEIITTPGQLTFRGDMGTYVFARTDDMFTFFENSSGRINPSYWAEKVQAQDIHSPVREYSKDLFVEHVLEEFWNRRDDLEDAAVVWREIREELLHEYGPAGDESLAITAAMEFRHGGFEFYDVTDWRLKTYSFHFLYALHAIVDGIRQYRQHQKSLQSAAVAA